MHGHDSLSVTWLAVNTIANLAIVAGYVLVPFTVLRYLPLTRNVMLSGSLFFITCALTHFSMAFSFISPWVLVVNHVIQAFAVLWFVFGFYRLLRQANRLRRTTPKCPPSDMDGAV